MWFLAINSHFPEIIPLPQLDKDKAAHALMGALSSRNFFEVTQEDRVKLIFPSPGGRG